MQDVVNALSQSGFLRSYSKAEVNYLLNTYLEHEYAAPAELLAVAALHEGDEYSGPDVLFPRGYDGVTRFLAKDLDIRLNHYVTGVDYSNRKVQIATADGQTLVADRVIVTVPLGVLKQGVIRFEPKLPSPKRKAIEALGMGVLNKLYLGFPRVFWDADVELIGHASRKKGRWCAWLNLAKYTKRPVLLGFNAGRYGEEIESMSNDEVAAEAMRVLRTIYGKNTPSPTFVLATRWKRDPFSFGSYSYLKVGAKPEMRKTLAAPVAGKLFFAGEATDSNYPATVHGAFLSGRREAKRVGQSLK